MVRNCYVNLEEQTRKRERERGREECSGRQVKKDVLTE